MLEGNWVDSSFVDSTIALGWTWLLLGRPEEALTTISRLRPREIPRDRGRYLLPSNRGPPAPRSLWESLASGL